MRYLALASDYDGTLAAHGRVDPRTLESVRRLLDSGRKFILVTGRELPDLLNVFPEANLCHLIVAENGALLYNPHTRQEKLLAEGPPEKFVAELKRRGVQPLSAGRSIVATWSPHEQTVLDVIRELGLELQVIFNKGAVMALPSGVNKGTGLHAALRQLCLSPHNTVGIGDAENDHALLNACECSVAVANSIPVLKEKADLVTDGARGEGVAELIDHLLENDLANVARERERHQIFLGRRDDQEVCIPAYGTRILVAGPSGSGKSSVVTALMERLREREYQFCVIDPEGDYEGFEHSVNIGGPSHAPTPDEVLTLLKNFENPIVNLLGVPLADRPDYFDRLVPHIQELRSHYGPPHWLIIDEAHHLLPASGHPASPDLPQDLFGIILITVHPDRLQNAVLSTLNTVIAVGDRPDETVTTFARQAGIAPPSAPSVALEKHEVLLWFNKANAHPVRVTVEPSETERLRHRRKYAQGDVQEKSFYFRGPENKLNLKAQNLSMFLQIAEGVDDDTWLFHLHQGDYSRWIREAIKDEPLAESVAEIERNEKSAERSRELIKDAITKQYTGAA
jgi:HAD superfamily hydrolase (TIGR01484 family)